MFDLQGKGRRGHRSERESLTHREKKFLGELSEGKSPTEAAMTAYNPKSRKVASQMGSAVMKRPRFLKVLERAGVTDKYLAKKLMEGFDALKPMATRQGTEMYADYQSRLGYLKTALKLKGHMTYEPEQENIEPLIVKAVVFDLKDRKVTFNDTPALRSQDTIEGTIEPETHRIDTHDTVTVTDHLHN